MFNIFRRRKPRVKDLGEGVWGRIYTRTERAVDRYHQVLENIADGDPRNQLILCGNRLLTVHENMFEVCLAAQRCAPSETLNVPPGPGGSALELHRGASKIPTLMAQAAEAAMLTKIAVQQGNQADADRSIAAVQRTTDQIESAFVSLKILSA